MSHHANKGKKSSYRKDKPKGKPKWVRYYGADKEKRPKDESVSVEEDFKDMDESRKFKRPILRGVTTAEVCTFFVRVKSYLVQVSAAQLSSSKLREAKNLVYCMTPEVMRYLVDHGFNNQQIRAADGSRITKADQITSDLFFRWVEKKAVRKDGPDLENRKQAFREKLLDEGKFRFTYVPGAGTIREQLLFHDSRLSLHYEENGMEEVMTDQDKIALYIRLLSPWALARCAVLAITEPGHDFTDMIDPDVKEKIKTDYGVFRKEIIACIVTEIAAGIQWNPEMLHSLNGKELTTAEQIQVGSLFKEALQARKAKRTEYRLKTLEEKLLKRDKRPESESKKKFKRAAVVEEEESESTASSGTDSTSTSAGKEDSSSSEEEKETDSDSDLDETSFNAVKMAFIRGNEKRGFACSNCGNMGCFSATCKEPCKFCQKAGCNSWMCAKRPQGYGKGAADKRKADWADHKKAKRIKKVKSVRVRKLNVKPVNQVSASICECYETDKVLLDTGSDKCCIPMALLKDIEKRVGNRIHTIKSNKPMYAEFANGEKVKCEYYAILPIVEFRQRGGGVIVKTNLKCLVIPGDLKELIIGQDLLVEEWGINVVELFNNLNRGSSPVSH